MVFSDEAFLYSKTSSWFNKYTAAVHSDVVAIHNCKLDVPFFIFTRLFVVL